MLATAVMMKAKLVHTAGPAVVAIVVVAKVVTVERICKGKLIWGRS